MDPRRTQACLQFAYADAAHHFIRSGIENEAQTAREYSLRVAGRLAEQIRGTHASLTFTTFTFLAFLVVVFALHWICSTRALQNLVLLVASYVFYAAWDWRFIFLLWLSTIVDWTLARQISREAVKANARRWVTASVAMNLILLGVFKYFNFFAESADLALQALGFEGQLARLNLILPVGISFYTFQSISYIVDVYRGDVTPARNPLDFALFVAFFPQLVAGPIMRARDLLPQFLVARKFSDDEARRGCSQMLWGFFKKIVIADNLAPIVDRFYAAPQSSSGLELALATIFFAFQIYCDFSGYSDIALGCARLFNIQLTRNFAYPYFSQSMEEFWRRWHISLSTWFRDYFYIPLGGGRVGPLRRAANVMLTFVVSGLWHGASWTFVVWGAINGAAVILERRLGFGEANLLAPSASPGGPSSLPNPARALRMGATFTTCMFAWVFFRAPTLGDAAGIVLKILESLVSPGAMPSFCLEVARQPELRSMTVILMAFTVFEWLQRAHDHPLQLAGFHVVPRWIAYTAVLWLCLVLAAASTGQFIYFQF